MIEVTPLILTYNEKENIGRTVAALAWAREIVLLDSFSTDETVTIARASHPNVRVVQRRFDDHTSQWNHGLDQVRTPWVLTLDADYEISAELSMEIRASATRRADRGLRGGFRFRVFGHALRATVYPPRTVLFRTGLARYRSDGHTQLLAADGPICSLAAPIYHDDRKPLSRWLQSQDRYMVIESRHLLAAFPATLSRQDRLRRRACYAPAVMFVYLLFVKRLVFDGWPGWFYVLQRTLAEAMLALRLLVEREKLEPP